MKTDARGAGRITDFRSRSTCEPCDTFPGGASKKKHAGSRASPVRARRAASLADFAAAAVVGGCAPAAVRDRGPGAECDFCCPYIGAAGVGRQNHDVDQLER